MSHFSAFVIIKSTQIEAANDAERTGAIFRQTIEGAIAPLLAPYHEFECTGHDDQYVVDVDQTEKARTTYLADTTTMLRCPDGSLTSPFDGTGNYKDMFARPESEGSTRKRLHLPEGYTEEQVPSWQIEDFATWAAGYYGRVIVTEDGTVVGGGGDQKYGRIVVRPRETLLTGTRRVDLGEQGKPTEVLSPYEVVKIIDRTNPNAKWDWYVLGGRWSGQFQADTRPVDYIRVGDWNIDRALEEANVRYGRYWDDMQAAISPHTGTFKTWEALREELGIRDRPADQPEGEHFDTLAHVRETYQNQPLMLAAKDVVRFDATPEEIADPSALSNGKLLGWGTNIEDFFKPREVYVALYSWGSIGSYAIVDENGWHSKGDMGWFGISHDSEDADQWPTKALELIRSLDANDYIACVDCHI